MIQFDEKIDEARLHQFASNVQHIAPHIQSMLREVILFDQPVEFYHGQLAALCFTHQLVGDRDPEKQQVLGALIALVSQHLIDHE